MYQKNTNKQDILHELRNLLGATGWFISGSYANPHITEYNDIDIYFTSENAYRKTLQDLNDAYLSKPPKQEMPFLPSNATTECATNIFYKSLPKLQLIHKHFGSPEQIFKTMDLNVCQHAIYPDGQYVRGRDANKPLHILNVNTMTFRRFIKYYERYARTFKTSLDLAPPVQYLVDTYIQDTRIVEDYYTTDGKTPINLALFQFILSVHCKNRLSPESFQDILNTIEEKAPELLFMSENQ